MSVFDANAVLAAHLRHFPLADFHPVRWVDSIAVPGSLHRWVTTGTIETELIRSHPSVELNRAYHRDVPAASGIGVSTLVKIVGSNPGAPTTSELHHLWFEFYQVAADPLPAAAFAIERSAAKRTAEGLEGLVSADVLRAALLA